MAKIRKADSADSQVSLQSSEETNKSKRRKVSKGNEEEKEWEEVRCPICWEHPHNAVRLHCISHKKGCRPYICNTGDRHSNCLAMFYKTFSRKPDPNPGSKPEIKCPSCRGRIIRWEVIESARRFMNSKPRSCSSETCEFVGNYADLRSHVRSEHPSVRPTKVDPERELNWAAMESQRDHRDTLLFVENDIRLMRSFPANEVRPGPGLDFVLELVLQ